MLQMFDNKVYQLFYPVGIRGIKKLHRAETALHHAPLIGKLLEAEKAVRLADAAVVDPAKW